MRSKPKLISTTSTRDRILAQAAKHFAQRGFNATSLREITRDADANPASVHYYFSSKAELYLEVIAGFRELLSKQRNDALLAINPKLRGTRRIRAVIHAYIAPHVRLCADPAAANYVRIVARATSETSYPVEIQIPSTINTLRDEFMRALKEALPSASEERIRKAFTFTVDLMLLAPVDTVYESLAGKTAWPDDPETLIEYLVEFCTAGIVATCS
ncbi:TetR/AcrR family transcriptional regulator [Povalibacter sp.]|uniref:TetR/AcrR family transcriptional regulator n=1 Tax=Povalibacter sp. TaxID=1962978 RepID=UPI002F42BAF1